MADFRYWETVLLISDGLNANCFILILKPLFQTTLKGRLKTSV
ncbi:hypothetical protein TW90_0024 [Neisseria flavescens]|nr:hypothetical protein TW90_0024 [Neisseria flavescens]